MRLAPFPSGSEQGGELSWRRHAEVRARDVAVSRTLLSPLLPLSLPLPHSLSLSLSLSLTLSLSVSLTLFGVQCTFLRARGDRSSRREMERGKKERERIAEEDARRQAATPN
jgi:hypothetical protein